ncbi:hypothetical protein QBC36DRAFT_288413 [Triangularia setosa]|uniref:Uncharacterized protein n=1 Tax=Triangularia setosa TaxID=2587417 RepID=A0AAN6WBI0_9PEZI|nr:hypothetical protein QBC36DRAFT_288413 [Podospora setosa]
MSKGDPSFKSGIFQFEYFYTGGSLSSLDGRDPSLVGSPFFHDHLPEDNVNANYCPPDTGEFSLDLRLTEQELDAGFGPRIRDGGNQPMGGGPEAPDPEDPPSTSMGIIRKTFTTAFLVTAGTVGYLGTTTRLESPLPEDDPLWRSKSFAKYNRHNNASTQDLVYKRIPLDKIKPELLQRDGDLALEFCRGVWGGLGEIHPHPSTHQSQTTPTSIFGTNFTSPAGYRFQRAYLARKYQGPATVSQLWTADQLSKSTYEPGTQLTDHFEVVEKTPTEIVVRCGDTPRNTGPRDSDGLFVISASVDKARGEVVLGLKSCFFNGNSRVEGIQGPMPGWMEELHRWYSRLWLVTGSWRVTSSLV